MYITDIISQTFKLWQLGTLVLISAPTGMGKTFFILNVLLPYAMENGVEILFLSNRTVLNQELIKKVCDMYDIPLDLMKDKNIAEFPGITIMTYQTLQQIIGRDMDYSRISFFHYVVADEVHYLCSDSEFSSEVQRFYKWFMNCNSAVKVAISATIEPVLPYLFDVNDGWADIIIGDHLTIYQRIQRNIINFALNQTERCFFYTVRDKATEYKVHVYESVDDLVSVINEDISDSKWLIFQANKEKAEENLKKKLFCSAAMLSADNKNSKTMETLIEQNMFEEKVLITTKVLDNGISIHDPKVRNIVLSTTSWADFMQMKGRRRIHPDENVQLNIYIPKLSKKYFENSLKANIEPALQLFERPISEILEVALSSNEGRKLVHQFYDIIHGKLTLNRIAENELTKKAEFYRSLIDGLKNDPDYFVKEQLKWLGGVDYERVVNLTEKRCQKALTDLVSVLTKQMEEPELLKNEQLNFRAQVKPMLAILCPSRFDHSNRMPGLNFINSCFKELGLSFRIDSQGGKKKGEETKWLIKKNIIISTPCFIGITTHFAGVFLSRKIAARTPYSKYLKLEEFENSGSALNEFFIRYPALKDCNEFTLNKLFRIKESPLYSVFSTLEHVVITEDANRFDKVEVLLPDDWREAYVKEGLTYDEAQEYARMRFIKIYKNLAFYISFPLRINVPVSFSYVSSKKNNLYRSNKRR